MAVHVVNCQLNKVDRTDHFIDLYTVLHYCMACVHTVAVGRIHTVCSVQDVSALMLTELLE